MKHPCKLLILAPKINVRLVTLGFPKCSGQLQVSIHWTHLSTGGSWGLVSSLWPLEARLPLSATDWAKSLELCEAVERLLLDITLK